MTVKRNKDEIKEKNNKIKKKGGKNIYFIIHINNKTSAIQPSCFITQKNTFPPLLVIGQFYKHCCMKCFDSVIKPNLI